MNTDKIKNLHMWTKIYFIFFAGLYGIIFIMLSIFLLNFYLETKDLEVVYYNGIPTIVFLIFLSLIFTAIFIIQTIRMKVISAINYYINVILIVVGFLSIVTIVPCVILFIQWISLDIRKAYYIEDLVHE